MPQRPDRTILARRCFARLASPRRPAGAAVLPLLMGGLAMLVGLFAMTAGADQPAAKRLLADARQAADRRDRSLAIRLASQALALPNCDAAAYYLRGRELLRNGDPVAALADLDRYATERPERADRLWERGIAAYYAGHYREGAKQFLGYQRFDRGDVENAVWFVICRARLDGFAEAARNMPQVGPDRRVPMKQIEQLFRSQGTIDDVFQAAEAGKVDQATRNYRRFYAHLYVGLFLEASGQPDKGFEQIRLAADKYPNDHYMWDVAKLHVQLRSLAH